ncbi:hypothetical protein [Cytobacillus oceanisediminis]|uniref:hypothetical protein n=1 Tax=Cytobacillus oceanisediminis TaxID=665099 RepID=UPI00203D4C63|nr:hypothetical protein [Cytobacillus oceanisediminis]MCM3393118.1 hypothetical protein [Cytobacillus oceanisediminis]
MSRQRRYKRKSGIIKIAAVFLLVPLAGIGYFFYQYQEGLRIAGSAELHPEYEFNGEKSWTRSMCC